MHRSSSLFGAVLICSLTIASGAHAQSSGGPYATGGGSCRPAGPGDAGLPTVTLSAYRLRIWTWLAQHVPGESRSKPAWLAAYRRSDPATAFRGKR